MSENSKKNCGMARDLMPLVIDGVCGESSKDFLKDHMAVCEECRQAYEKMQQPADTDPVQVPPTEENKALAKSVKKTARRMKRRRWLLIVMIPVLLWAVLFTASEINQYRMFVEKPLPMNTFDISLRRSDHYVSLDVNIYNAPGGYMQTVANYDVITAQTEKGLQRAAVITLTPTYCPNRHWDQSQGRIVTYSLNGPYASMLYAEGNVLYTINNANYDYENIDNGEPFQLHLTLGMPVAQIRVTDGTESQILYNWGEEIAELSKDSVQFSRPYEVNTTSNSDSVNNAILWNTEVFISDEDRAAFDIPEIILAPVQIPDSHDEPLPTLPPFRTQNNHVAEVPIVIEANASPLVTPVPENRSDTAWVTVESSPTPMISTLPEE